MHVCVCFRDIDVPLGLPFNEDFSGVQKSSVGERGGSSGGGSISSAAAALLMQQDEMAACVGAKLQLKLWYDKMQSNLIITVIGAFELVPREEEGAPRNVYVKIHLLPLRRYVQIMMCAVFGESICICFQF